MSFLLHVLKGSRRSQRSDAIPLGKTCARRVRHRQRVFEATASVASGEATLTNDPHPIAQTTCRNIFWGGECVGIFCICWAHGLPQPSR
jgi:hypothetical protein